jgi:hypothetical protein
MLALVTGVLVASFVTNTAYAHNALCDGYCIQNGIGLSFTDNFKFVLASFVAVSALAIFVMVKNIWPQYKSNIASG